MTESPRRQPRRHRPLACLPLLALLSLLLAASLQPASCTDPIKYVTYGPDVVSPYGCAALLQQYNLSYAGPRQPNQPTLSIGLSLSLGYDALLTGMDVALQYIVDMVNFRGGLYVAGVPHYLSVTYSPDGASPELTQYIYQDMYASGNYSLYMAPSGDNLLQSLFPFLRSTQSLMFSVYNNDPADFVTPATNLVSLFNTESAEWVETLNLINQAAQAYAAAGGADATSVYGIKTFCMLSTNATLVQAAAEGVRGWIAKENARRGHADNITVYVDGVWAANVTGTYADYVPYLAACPDGVDLMLLQDGSTTTVNAQLALKASRLRPKAAIGLDPESTLLGSASATLDAAGWTCSIPASTSLVSTLPYVGSKWYGLGDIVYSQMVWGAGANVSGQFPIVGYAYTASFDILTAGLATSASKQPADVRAALQRLNGRTSALTGIEFDNVTGVNTATANTLIQIQADGSYHYLANTSDALLGFNTSVIAYPYPWSWRGLVRPGDALDKAQSSGLAILAVVIAVLGAWVAQIITEQSIFERRRGGWWRCWLFMVALSLGGVGVWAAQLMAASGLVVSKPYSTGLHLSFAMGDALLAWLPSLALTYAGLLLLIGDVESRAVVAASKASQAQQALREQKEAAKKRAALSNSAHLAHLWNAITWRAIAGGLCVALAIGGTRALLCYVWVQDASFTAAGWAWAVSTLFNALCVPLALLCYFHALRWRVAAVFLFAACVMLDYQVQWAGLTFHYAPGHQYLPASLLTANVDSTIVNLLAGIIAAFICFIFIGLQFSRMQLSRNGLSVLVASLERNKDDLKASLRAEKAASAQKDSQLGLLARMLELVNTTSPIATEYAFALSTATTYGSYVQLLQSMAPAAQAGSMGSTLKSQLTRRGTQGSPLHSGVSAEHEPSKSMGAHALRSAASMRFDPPAAAAASEERGSGAEPADDAPSASKSLPSARSNTLASVHPASPKKLSGTLVDHDSLISMQASPRSTAAPSINHTASTMSQRVLSKRHRAYEDELQALLEAQQSWRDDAAANGPPTAASTLLTVKSKRMASTTGPSNTAADGAAVEFDLAMPLLGRGRDGSSASAAAYPTPSLSLLLSHPVCAEVLKAELQQLHSVENLVFYQHAVRYRHVQSARLRKTLAAAIHDTFVREHAPQQININTRQRDAITAAVTRKSDECAADLFRDAEREVLQLMETNVMKGMQHSSAMRLCSWVLASVPTSGLVELAAADDHENTQTILYDVKSSVHSVAEESLSHASGE